MLPPVSTFFKEENDPFYRKGYEKGCMQVKRENALKMKEVGIEINLIADIIGLSIEEITKL